MHRYWPVAVALVLMTFPFVSSSAQKTAVTPQSVKVVNTTAQPVPVTAQGTTTVTGNVNVTTVPITGTVAVSNSSVPVSGSVSVSNLPLDSNGNLKTTTASPVLKYEFTDVITMVYTGTNVISPDPNPSLTSLSASGWELINVTAFPYSPVGTIGGIVIYTLRREVQ